MISMPKRSHIWPKWVLGAIPLSIFLLLGPEHTHSSSRYTTLAVPRSFRSSAVTPALPPRWFPAPPSGPASCWWRHPPDSSSSLGARVSQTIHESCRPSAPTPQSVLCAPAAAARGVVSGLDSIAHPPTSTAARSPHALPVRPRSPGVPTPTSARTSPPPPQSISSLPFAILSPGASSACSGSILAPRSGASTPQFLPAGIVARFASSVGSYVATAAPHPP